MVLPRNKTYRIEQCAYSIYLHRVERSGDAFYPNHSHRAGENMAPITPKPHRTHMKLPSYSVNVSCSPHNHHISIIPTFTAMIPTVEIQQSGKRGITSIEQKAGKKTWYSAGLLIDITRAIRAKKKRDSLHATYIVTMNPQPLK